jgi:hypothetical protein
LSIYDLNRVGTEDLQARIDEVIDCTIAEKRLVGAVVRLASVSKPIVSKAALVLTKSKSGGNSQ